MSLPTNMDAVYPDDAADASVKTHQQHHDTLHALHNTTEARSPLRDTLANLAATNPVAVVNRLVIATDSSPLTFAIGDGVTAWLALPKYEEQLVPQWASTTTATAVGAGLTTDRTGLVVTFTVGSVPWIVKAHEPYVYCDIVGGLPVVVITDAAGASKAKALGIINPTANPFYFGVVPTAIERITVPGTYTRKTRVNNAGTGIVTFGSLDYAASLTAGPER